MVENTDGHEYLEPGTPASFVDDASAPLPSFLDGSSAPLPSAPSATTAWPVNHKLLALCGLDLGRTPYVLYGVKYIGLVSLGARMADLTLQHRSPIFKMAQHLDSRCVLLSIRPRQVPIMNPRLHLISCVR